ncbi:MAG: hypothetical protein N2509_02605, partial [Treponemataceae bacterium]|nr:hypothetical protein [Treponemataceae bacterium]
PGGGVFFCAGLEAELPPTRGEGEGPGGPRQAAEFDFIFMGLFAINYGNSTGVRSPNGAVL